MSNFLNEFVFEESPNKITYLEGEPLRLNNEFVFFHNKSKFRKELTRLQYLIKSYTNTALIASGIRDSFLREELTEKYLIVLFTTPQIVQKTNEIVEAHSKLNLKPGCFYVESNSEFMLLLACDIEGLTLGIDVLETILKQVLEEYTNQNKVDDYIKIRSFNLIDCIKKPK